LPDEKKAEQQKRYESALAHWQEYEQAVKTGWHRRSSAMFQRSWRTPSKTWCNAACFNGMAACRNMTFTPWSAASLRA
jgi:hypothetical protein